MNTRECNHCRESKGVSNHGHCYEKKAYDAQQSWNRKMARILAQDGQQPIPEAPDYSPKAMSKWIVSQSITESITVHDDSKVIPNLWWREMHALLQKEPKPMRGFSFMPKGEVQ